MLLDEDVLGGTGVADVLLVILLERPPVVKRDHIRSAGKRFSDPLRKDTRV